MIDCAIDIWHRRRHLRVEGRARCGARSWVSLPLHCARDLPVCPACQRALAAATARPVRRGVA